MTTLNLATGRGLFVFVACYLVFAMGFLFQIKVLSTLFAGIVTLLGLLLGFNILFGLLEYFFGPIAKNIARGRKRRLEAEQWEVLFEEIRDTSQPAPVVDSSYRACLVTVGNLMIELHDPPLLDIRGITMDIDTNDANEKAATLRILLDDYPTMPMADLPHHYEGIPISYRVNELVSPLPPKKRNDS